MPKITVAQIANQLKDCLGREKIEAQGRRSGFERRSARVIGTTAFLSSLLKSLGTRKVTFLAELHRDFNADHGTEVNYKPFYERLDSPGFVELTRSLCEDFLNELSREVLLPSAGSLLADFDDILLHDGTSFALHDALKRTFPGRFTANKPAAVELHATMSLKRDNLVNLTLAADCESERLYAPEPAGLTNCLLLADRGYDSTAYMQAIVEASGSFCIRVRSTLNPEVARIARKGTVYRKLEGKRLNDVIKKLPKGKVHDLDVVWRDGRGQETRSFRLVLSYNRKDKRWTRLMTNLPRDRASCDVICSLYRLRWQVELYFKELKSYANLHEFQTRKPHIAEGLIWASLCAAFLKRYIAHGCQLAASEHAISTQRVATCSVSPRRMTGLC
ncbi:MAG: IS4 family transposase [Myxococcales bacterium]|nr:IS4 family transposase [Myxococcales bacterium]